MEDSSCYEIELTVAGNPSDVCVTVNSIAEVQAFAESSLVPNSVLCVLHIKGWMDNGYLVIYLNTSGLAYVRLCADFERHATRPLNMLTEGTVQFERGDGTFEVDANSTIPAATAMEALGHWLTTGEQYPGVCWQKERT